MPGERHADHRSGAHRERADRAGSEHDRDHSQAHDAAQRRHRNQRETHNAKNNEKTRTNAQTREDRSTAKKQIEEADGRAAVSAAHPVLARERAGRRGTTASGSVGTPRPGAARGRQTRRRRRAAPLTRGSARTRARRPASGTPPAPRGRSRRTTRTRGARRSSPPGTTTRSTRSTRRCPRERPPRTRAAPPVRAQARRAGVACVADGSKIVASLRRDTTTRTDARKHADSNGTMRSDTHGARAAGQPTPEHARRRWNHSGKDGDNRKTANGCVERSSRCTDAEAEK